VPAGKCTRNNILFFFALVVGILLLFCNRVTTRAAYYTRGNVYANIIYVFFFYMTITLTQFVASRLLFFFIVKILFDEKKYN